MRTRIFSRMLSAAAILAIAPALLNAAHSHEPQSQLGRKGRVTVVSSLTAGQTTLEPGMYTVQHRDEGGRHFIRFTRGQWVPLHTPKARRFVKTVVAEAPCEIEALDSKVKTTAVSVAPQNGVARLRRIEIKGETVAHAILP